MTSQPPPDDTGKADKPKPTLPVRQWVMSDEPDRDAVQGEQLELFYHAKLFVGPIPPPDLLQEYAQVDKFLPDRLVAMAEREQAIRHVREDRQFEAGAASAKRAQICATLIALSAMCCSVPIAIWGNPWAAGVIGFGGVIGHIIPVLFKKPRPERSKNQRDSGSSE